MSSVMLAEMRAFSLRGDGEIMFYAGAVKSGIMGVVAGSGKFKTITDYEKAIGETEKTIVDLSHQQYEHMMNGDQPKMDALTPMIGQALNVRDQLRVEMGNQMGLGSDGWASQNPNMLEKKTFSSEPLSTNVDRFTPEQQSKEDVLVGEHLPVNPNHLTPEHRSKADVYVGEDAVAGQYVPITPMPSGALTLEEQSKRRVIVGEGAGAGQYIDDMTQTFGGMSEGLEATQKDSSINMQPIFSFGLGEQKNGEEDFLNLAGDDRVAVQLMSDIKNTMTGLGQMTQEEQIGFISSEEGKEYLGKLGQLETRIGPLAFETFKNELAGNNALHENNGNGANDTPIFSMNHYTAQQLLENASMSTNNGVEKILNPTTDDNVYITEEDYNDLLKTKTEERDSCVSSMDYHYARIFLGTDNSQYHQDQYNKYLDMSVELDGEIAMLNGNRDLSKRQMIIK